MPRRPLLLLILCLGFLLGCAGVGPRALETARGSYNEVLRDTADEQLLAPTFRKTHTIFPNAVNKRTYNLHRRVTKCV